MESCQADEGADRPIEKSWLYRYYDMMAHEEKSKAAEKNTGSDANRISNSNSKSEGKKLKSSSKKA